MITGGWGREKATPLEILKKDPLYL